MERLAFPCAERFSSWSRSMRITEMRPEYGRNGPRTPNKVADLAGQRAVSVGGRTQFPTVGANSTLSF